MALSYTLLTIPHGVLHLSDGTVASLCGTVSIGLLLQQFSHNKNFLTSGTPAIAECRKNIFYELSLVNPTGKTQVARVLSQFAKRTIEGEDPTLSTTYPRPAAQFSPAPSPSNLALDVL